MKASVEIILRAYNIEQGYINIPAKKMYNFPDKKRMLNSILVTVYTK